MIRPCEGEAYVFSRVVHVVRYVVAVEINCTRVAKMDPTIALRSNWSCLSQRIWSKFGEGDVASGRVISVGHGKDGFESSTKPSKSCPNRRDMNSSFHAE